LISRNLGFIADAAIKITKKAIMTLYSDHSQERRLFVVEVS
jgi:hypothetical protein